MEKTYNPQNIEQRWYQTWESNGYFKASGVGPSYCIMIPPPNVTGSLHMGHAFQTVIMDTLIRYHRMMGHNTLWQVGTDHAGIATQMVVERQLAAENLSRRDLKRAAFVDKVWQWKKESGNTITNQLRRMGASTDWSRERFTMDDGLSEAVRDVFVQLYHEGLIYRGKRLVNWDPVLHTAISDLEVLKEPEQSSLWHMRYPILDSDQYIVVATTRPETMLGDSAVAVNPNDERFRHLVGRMVTLPLANRHIPIIADDYVDPAFGSGCVKITPAHDFNDYEVGVRHNLPMINIFTENAAINENGPLGYRGLDRFEARKKIIDDLQSVGLLDKIEPHSMMVPRGQRSGSVVEPYLTNQWFVKIDSLAKPAMEAVAQGRIRFVPENWVNTYNEWMRNIQDWCISRQLWWGHRIPAWYDQQGNIYVAANETEVREKYQLTEDISLTQDEDVLDTWFSSALWPFSTLGWPKQTDELRTFYPTQVLVTGFDIIFFWVARMIMMGLKFTGEVPFRDIYIHGLVRDSQGQKMSKSKGNVLDPLDLIDGVDLETLIKKRTTGMMLPKQTEQISKQTRKEFPNGIDAYGTDSLRFTFGAMASTGRNINFDLGRIEGYRNFCNKLWNAARFVLMHCENKSLGDENSRQYTVADRWIQSRLQATVEVSHKCIQQYRFDQFAQALYDFTWNEFCDWYVELSKPVLQGDDETLRAGTRHTLITVLESLLRLAHPLIPFISEEIWQRVAPVAHAGACALDSIMLQPYPKADVQRIDEKAENEMDWIMQFILGIRKIRSGYDIHPTKALPVLVQNPTDDDLSRLEKYRMYLHAVGKIKTIELIQDEEAPQAATALLGTTKLLIPLAGLIDIDAEIKRLENEQEKVRTQLQKSEAKLANQNFVINAPSDVVEQERTRVAVSKETMDKLLEQLNQLNAISDP